MANGTDACGSIAVVRSSSCGLDSVMTTSPLVIQICRISTKSRRSLDKKWNRNYFPTVLRYSRVLSFPGQIPQAHFQLQLNSLGIIARDPSRTEECGDEKVKQQSAVQPQCRFKQQQALERLVGSLRLCCQVLRPLWKPKLVVQDDLRAYQSSKLHSEMWCRFGGAIPRNMGSR